MSIYLLDVNVLIAMAWPVHVHHPSARNWFDAVGKNGWATCPVTQMAFVRISSNPSIIKDAVSPEQALEVLQLMTKHSGHHFWEDSLSMADDGYFFQSVLTGSRQVTDACLLSLAIHNRGTLATFDRGISALGSEQHITVLDSSH